MRWSADGNAYRNSAQPHRGERVREGILPPRIIGPEPPRFLKMRYRLGSLSEIGKDIYPMKVRSDKRRSQMPRPVGNRRWPRNCVPKGRRNQAVHRKPRPDQKGLAGIGGGATITTITGVDLPLSNHRPTSFGSGPYRAEPRAFPFPASRGSV